MRLSPTRRDVLEAGLAALAFRALPPRPQRTEPVPPCTLVLLQLSGGNDGLSTIVPHGDDAYHRARPTLALHRKRLLPLDDYRGFPRDLRNLHELYQRGHVAVVEGVGYTDMQRSHFASLEVWHTAGTRGTGSDGWISRLRDVAWGECDAQTIAHVGPRPLPALSSRSRSSVAFTRARDFRFQGTPQQRSSLESIVRPDPADRPALASIRQAWRDALQATDNVRAAARRSGSETIYPPGPTPQCLREAAALIKGRVGARVLSLEWPGFDTHVLQRERHADLWRRVDAAIGAFTRDVWSDPEHENVLVMVYSEFGRRVAENAARGTDHGKAGPVLVLGPAVRGGLYGQHPSLSELDDGDLAPTTDFRSVYATIIERGFGVVSEKVLGKRWPLLGLL